ncbi:hypothetical protein [Caballeronia grimmiae]
MEEILGHASLQTTSIYVRGRASADARGRRALVC